MLTIKNNETVKTITFEFINSTRGLKKSGKVTFPLTNFVTFEYKSSIANKDKYLVQFNSVYNSGIIEYEINKPTFQAFFRIFAKHELDTDYIDEKPAVSFLPFDKENSKHSKKRVTIIIDEILSVSCVTYRAYAEHSLPQHFSLKRYELRTRTDTYEISEEDYNEFEKIITKS